MIQSLDKLLEEINKLKKSNYKMVNTTKMKYAHHLISKIQPNMNNSDYESLLNDIKLQGVLEPIIVYEGKILDGRHRQRACIELQISVPVIELKGKYSKELLTEYIRSKHMNRNLTNIQKQCQAFNYKKTTIGVNWKDASNRFGVSERAIKNINTLYNELKELGYANDFNTVFDNFENGKVCHHTQFAWLKKRCASFSNALKQLREFRDAHKTIEIEPDIDLTEVNPITGEVLKKDKNFFMKEDKRSKEEILQENEQLKEEIKQLKNQLQNI